MTAKRRAILSSFVLSICLGGSAAYAATADQLASFFRAVQTDDAGTVGKMVGTVIAPDQINPVGGEPALVLAAREGSMRVLDVLLAAPGIHVDATAMNGNTALMMAAYKRNMPAVRALLDKGAAVNRTGWTPLHYAAAAGDDDITRLLLEHGALVDAVSPLASGAYTPLMMAAREGHDRTAKLLIAHGANTRLTNSEGLTATQIAQRAGKDHVAGALTAPAIAR